MTSLLKGQIIKHLTKFFKNLSPDSLNLSTLKGQCALTNLELNEAVLMEIFEFPCWLNLRRALCNKVSINVPWMKIKSQPIQFSLDQVTIDIETCENFRKNGDNSNRGLPVLSSGKYGFTDKVIDGIRIKIDSLEVNFISPAFKAQFTLLQILVESRLPNFKPVDSISQTKIKDTVRKQILLFKYVEWSSLRFEARAEQFAQSAPLRLITRGGCCKVTLKKSLQDCSTIAAKLLLCFDDLLWILTDTTLLSAIHLVKHIAQLVDRAPLAKKNISSPKSTKLNGSDTSNVRNINTVSQLFDKYDVLESSFHALIHRLQLHLSDDLHRSAHSSLANGGGLHIELSRLVFDLYLFHSVMGSRAHWFRYATPSQRLDNFIEEHFVQFLTRDNADLRLLLDSGERRSAFIRSRMQQLLSFTMLLRVGDYRVHTVSTTQTERAKQRKFSRKNAEKTILRTSQAFPNDLPALHVEMSTYFFNEPGTDRASLRLKAPDPIAYVHVAPCIAHLHTPTLLWANAFYASLHKSLLASRALFEQNNTAVIHTLVEIILPTLVLQLQDEENIEDNILNSNSSQEKVIDQEGLDKQFVDELKTHCPKNEPNPYIAIDVKCTKLTLTNVIGSKNGTTELCEFIKKMKSQIPLFNGKNYPWLNNHDLLPFGEEFLLMLERMSQNEQTVCANIWQVQANPAWIDFRTTVGNRSETLIEPFDTNIWLHTLDSLFQQDTLPSKQEADLNVIVKLPDLRLAVNRYHYLFVMRLLEQVDELFEFLSQDSQRILDLKQITTPKLNLCAFIPNIHLFVKLHEQCIQAPHMNLRYDATDEPSLDEPTLSGSRSPTICERNLWQRTDTLTITSSVSNLSMRSEATNEAITVYSPSEDDTRSIRSDLSAESEKLLALDLDEEECSLFNATSLNEECGAEEALEMVEGDLSDCDESDQLERLRIQEPQVLDYLVLRLYQVALVKQNQQNVSTLLAHVHDICISGHENSAYNEYKVHYQASVTNSRTLNPRTLCARIDACPGLQKKELLTAKITHLNDLCLSANLLPKLSDFLLDSEMRKVSALSIFLDDVCISLPDPKLRVPPMRILLHQTLLTRDCENQLRFEHVASNASDDLKENNVIDQLGEKILLRLHRKLLNLHDPLVVCPNGEKSFDYEVLHEALQKMKAENIMLKAELEKLQSNDIH